MEKVITKLTLKEASDPKRDLEYWLSRPIEERISAVETLREQVYGGQLPRIEKVVRKISLSEDRGSVEDYAEMLRNKEKSVE